LDNDTSFFDKNTAGPQAIGFDYQFYYFLFLALGLKPGEKIGFEVKDDIHIDKPNGKTVLFQAKHSVRKNKSGKTINLTDSDSDLWKTLSNWADFIKKDKKFIENHEFIILTNKNNESNKFIENLEKLKETKINKDIIALIDKIKDESEDDNLVHYIKNIKRVGVRKLKIFLLNLKIETGKDEIVKKIKNRILEGIRQKKYVDVIYDCLYSNAQISKFFDIKNKTKFYISFEDFSGKFGECFKVAIENSPLPKRKLKLNSSENLEDQIFIKQLIDVGETHSGSKDIIKYTTNMLSFLNDFTYWTEEENFVLLTEAEDFKDNSINLWANEFKSKYRTVENKINSGVSQYALEVEIKKLAIELVEFLRREELTLKNNKIGIDYSNGHFYALSNDLEIGWHFNWEEKYKEKK
jgi:hypothetical protein